MLDNKVILYDDNCPMCRVYTQGFVRMGILAPQGRVGLAHAPSDLIAPLDLDRARHEIPLLDTQTGVVTYGMDALFTLIGHRFPVFHSLFRHARFRALIYSVYQLVTYNRRVIAGCAPTRGGFDCAPDFNRVVRLRYLRFALCVWAALGLGVTGAAIAAHQVGLAGLLLAVLIGQGADVRQMPRNRRAWDRIGGFATDNLLFGLLIAPSLLPLSPALRWTNFGAALCLTLLDVAHRERSRRACRCKNGGAGCKKAAK